LKQKEGKNRTG